MNLYRKYRSQNFSDVVGQKPIVDTIVSAIKNDRVGHAYLFSGPRGTGKTTLARLLAKSLNCINRKDREFEPCNDCASCNEIKHGTSMDIIEIDAASNRGIDEIRQLREKIGFAAAGKKFKIFIIDEVHMLTKEAFNALLKTLEEPPKHVVFIMATTELNKVPDTILSRTMQFDFKLHNDQDVKDRLKHIAKMEKIDIDDEAINIIVKSASGGLRDAITYLDQVSASEGFIDKETVREIIGLGSGELTFDLIQSLLEQDANKAFGIVKQAIDNGVDAGWFLDELLDNLRSIMIASVIEESNFKKKEILSKVNKSNLLKIINKVIKTISLSKQVNQSWLLVEVMVYDLVRNESTDLSSDQTLSREDLFANKTKTSKSQEKSHSYSIKVEKNEVEDKKNYLNKDIKKGKVIDDKTDIETDKKISKADIKKLEQIKEDWSAIVEKIVKEDKAFKVLLAESRVNEVSKDGLLVGVQFKFYKDKLEDKKIYQNLLLLLEKNAGVSVGLNFEVDEKLVKEPPKSTGDSLSGADSLSTDIADIFS